MGHLHSKHLKSKSKHRKRFLSLGSLWSVWTPLSNDKMAVGKTKSSSATNLHSNNKQSYEQLKNTQQDTGLRNTDAGPHMEVSDWLESLDLGQYEILFQKYRGVEDMLILGESDLKKMGVNNSSHRARLSSSLVVLRHKRRKGKGSRRLRNLFGNSQQNRYSVAMDSGIGQEASKFFVDLPEEGPSSQSLGDLTMDSTEAQSQEYAGTPTNPHQPTALETQQQLKRALEWELGQDSRELRSHAWYHGAIPRQRSEEILENDGDFLVRDCLSQPGDYVLTCKWKGLHLHFLINKMILQPDTVYERVQFRFEDDSFDAVPDLVTFYVGSGKPVSQASGAKIQSPKNRIFPLSHYATKYGGWSTPMMGSRTNLYSCATGSPYNTYRSPKHSPPCGRKNSDSGQPPRLPAKNRSQSLTPGASPAGSGDGTITTPQKQSTTTKKFTTHSLPRPGNNGSRLVRVTSDPTLSPSPNRRNSISAGSEVDQPEQGTTPPPKPSRVSYRGDDAGPEQTRSGDSGNGSGDSVTHPAQPTNPSGVFLKRPNYSPTVTSTVLQYDSSQEDPMALTVPELDPNSDFDIEDFHTLLLPHLENKPLDASALQAVKLILNDTASRVLACHLTKTDLDLIKTNGDNDLGLGVTSGIELCTLPHGHQLRKDLIERTECLKLFVAVTILTCGTVEERAEMLHKWILIAIDTKTALGNLYGFSGLMLGLCLPQVQRLTNTWHYLRQKHTDTAYNFEAKLRPSLKATREGSDPMAPNTTLPHLLPFILVYDAIIDEDEPFQNHPLCPWTTPTADFGLQLLLTHLDQARRFTQQLTLFKRNSEIVLSSLQNWDDLTLETFRTEFHLNFLWGSRGATVASDERHEKFVRVLAVMSERCETTQ